MGAILCPPHADGCAFASTGLVHVHDNIDRVSPTLEPDQPVLMYQNWHHLGLFHWEVPLAELRSRVPAGLTLDTFEGKAYIALVPFTVTGARPILAPPIPPISNFHEINVRTYVHHKGKDPGVWFFSLDASSAIAVSVARAAYHLAYLHATIEFAASNDALPEIAMSVRRDDPRSTDPAHAHLRYRPAEGLTTTAVPGTFEHFLIERYILYAQDENHQLYRARVHHQPYAIQRAEISQLDETLIWASGIKRSDAAPIRHYAREVNVKVYPPVKV